jgi:hypothetical protein
MGYRGMLYKWGGDEIIAVLWDKVFNINPVGVPPKKELSLPVSDNNGWAIVNGLSTKPNISYEEKIDRVVSTLVSQNYPKDYIKDYLTQFNR